MYIESLSGFDPCSQRRVKSQPSHYFRPSLLSQNTIHGSDVCVFPPAYVLRVDSVWVCLYVGNTGSLSRVHLTKGWAGTERRSSKDWQVWVQRFDVIFLLLGGGGGDSWLHGIYVFNGFWQVPRNKDLDNWEITNYMTGHLSICLVIHRSEVRVPLHSSCLFFLQIDLSFFLPNYEKLDLLHCITSSLSWSVV